MSIKTHLSLLCFNAHMFVDIFIIDECFEYIYMLLNICQRIKKSIFYLNKDKSIIIKI